jgi:beta-aspartyl-dipeptidase (metallo-type)
MAQRESMLTLIREGRVFSPLDLGKKDILMAAGKIAAVAEPSSISLAGVEVDVLEASNKIVLPAFVDSHVHILGGGGEGGPASRAPEINVESIVSSGVSTVIGCLGTDCTTRHMESLLAKAKALDEEGVDAYIFTGGWGVPPLSLTGSVQSDLVLIDKVVGVGELAIAEPLSTQPGFDDLAKIASQCRLGGLLGGKAGILHLHVGSDASKLEMLYRLVETTGIPPTQFIPTHINYSEGLLSHSVPFIEAGGRVDLNAFDDPASDERTLSVASAIRFYKAKNVSLENISVSSDANGSLAVFDERGRMTGLTVADPGSLLENFRYLMQNQIVDPETAIRCFSTNPATFYDLVQKGEIGVGKDADLIMMDLDFNLTDVIARGRRMVVDGEAVVSGTFS